MRRHRWAAVAAFAAMGTATVFVAAGAGDAAPEVHLTAAGDYGASPATDGVLAEIARLDPDAHVVLGDLAYGYSPTPYRWCDYVKGFVGEGFPFQLLAGNHESEDNNDGHINDFSACLPNQVPGVEGIYGREYVMDLPANGTPLVRVIQISPNLTFEGTRWQYRSGDEHWRWLEAAIDDGRARGARWIVVGAHHPCLTVGANGCPSIDDVYDLLIAERVDLVLHGHEHSYARTHQLAAGRPGCTALAPRSYDPDCVVDRDDDFTAGAGTVFATVGTGGIQLRDVNPGDAEAGYFAAWSGANSDPSHGLLDLRITADELTGTFVPTSGDFTDAFRISAASAPTPSTTTAITSAPAATTTTTTTAPTTTAATTTTTSTTTTSIVTTTTVAPAPSVPTAAVVAADAFDRARSDGWGDADIGGTWTVSNAPAFEVADGAGSITNQPGTARQAHLRDVATANADVELTLSTDTLGGGSGLYVSVIARSVPGVGDYRAVVRSRADGRITLRLDRGSSTIVPEAIVPGLTARPDQRLDVRVEATGTDPTRLAAKVWEHGTAEPAGWLRSTSDSTSAYQTPGSVGLSIYLSSGAGAPVTTSIEELTVTDRP